MDSMNNLLPDQNQPSDPGPLPADEAKVLEPLPQPNPHGILPAADRTPSRSVSSQLRELLDMIKNEKHQLV